ncbi:MAG TPA: YciI family protein [Gemmatimonadaceae bacterium]
MYAIAIIRYRRPLDEVQNVQEAHRTYLGELKESGLLIASGPMDPRTGGVLLLSVPDDDVQEALDKIRDEDPYVTFGLAQYELIPWVVGIGREDLDRIVAQGAAAE